MDLIMFYSLVVNIHCVGRTRIAEWLAYSGKSSGHQSALGSDALLYITLCNFLQTGFCMPWSQTYLLILCASGKYQACYYKRVKSNSRSSWVPWVHGQSDICGGYNIYIYIYFENYLTLVNAQALVMHTKTVIKYTLLLYSVSNLKKRHLTQCYNNFTLFSCILDISPVAIGWYRSMVKLNT